MAHCSLSPQACSQAVEFDEHESEQRFLQLGTLHDAFSHFVAHPPPPQLSVHVDPLLQVRLHPPLGQEKSHVAPLEQLKLQGSVEPQVRLHFSPAVHEQSFPATQFDEPAVVVLLSSLQPPLETTRTMETAAMIVAVRERTSMRRDYRSCATEWALVEGRPRRRGPRDRTWRPGDRRFQHAELRLRIE